MSKELLLKHLSPSHLLLGPRPLLLKVVETGQSRGSGNRAAHPLLSPLSGGAATVQEKLPEAPGGGYLAGRAPRTWEATTTCDFQPFFPTCFLNAGL